MDKSSRAAFTGNIQPPNQTKEKNEAFFLFYLTICSKSDPSRLKYF